MRDYMMMSYYYLKNQNGQGILEYALILTLIVVIGMATMSPIGTKIAQEFVEMVAKI